MKKIYTVAYKLAILNVHNSSIEEQKETYKQLLLKLLKEIEEKKLHLK